MQKPCQNRSNTTGGSGAFILIDIYMKKLIDLIAVMSHGLIDRF